MEKCYCIVFFRIVIFVCNSVLFSDLFYSGGESYKYSVRRWCDLGGRLLLLVLFDIRSVLDIWMPAIEIIQGFIKIVLPISTNHVSSMSTSSLLRELRDCL